MPIRVLLVDDDPMVRAGLKFLLDSADDLEVVAEAGDGVEAVAACRVHTVDVVLMDLRMPRVDGIAATRGVRALPDPPHVIALTTWDVDDAVMDSLVAGASGFLLKTSAPREIMGAIRSVMVGGRGALPAQHPSVARPAGTRRRGRPATSGTDGRGCSHRSGA